jgi:hypothetical protein
LIFEKNTYRSIAFGFLALLLTLLVAPTIIVASIDENVDISMVFSFVEEESEIKGELNVDDFFQSNSFIPENAQIRAVSTSFSFNKILTSLSCPGIIVPPPEFS